MRRPTVRPNPAKDKDRRRDIRLWFDEFQSAWRCRFCRESYHPILSVYADPASSRPPVDVARMARDGKSPDEITRVTEQGVILCPTCKAKLACLPSKTGPRPRARR